MDYSFSDMRDTFFGKYPSFLPEDSFLDHSRIVFARHGHMTTSLTVFVCVTSGNTIRDEGAHTNAEALVDPICRVTTNHLESDWILCIVKMLSDNLL